MSSGGIDHPGAQCRVLASDGVYKHLCLALPAGRGFYARGIAGSRSRWPASSGQKPAVISCVYGPKRRCQARRLLLAKHGRQTHAAWTMKSTGVAALFSILLKVFAAASALVGIGFIAFGFILQSPAKSFVPV